jgi:hypothetical protein
MRKFLCFFIVFSMSFSVFAGPDISDVRTRGKMKNQIYFFVDGQKMHILYPYNYLGDNNPLKKRAIEAVEVHYRELLASWVSFYLDFAGIKDADLRAALKDVSIAGRKKLEKMIQQKPLEAKDPLAIMERAYQVSGKQIVDAGNMLSPAAKDNFIEQNLAEYNKQQAYLLNSTIDFRKLFEQNLEQFDQYLPWENLGQSSISRFLPDFWMLQVYGHWRSEWLKNLQNNRAHMLTKHPHFGKFIAFLTKSVLEASKFRLSFLVRPWVHTTYDFNTGQKIHEDIGHLETGTYVWYNMAHKFKHIKDDRFLRVGIGGINGNFENVAEMQSLMGGMSANVGAMNVKLGLISPLSLNVTKVFNLKKFFGQGENYGYYYLVGYQKGMLYGDITPDPITPDKPGDSAIEEDKSKKKVRYSKSGGSVDYAVFWNLSSAIEKLGADYSGLSQQLLQLLNLKSAAPSNPGAGCWKWDPKAGVMVNTCGGTPGNPGIGIPLIPANPGHYGLYYKNLGTALASMDQNAAAMYVESMSPQHRRGLIEAHFDYSGGNYYYPATRANELLEAIREKKQESED